MGAVRCQCVRMDVDGHRWGWMGLDDEDGWMGVVDVAAVDCGWAPVWLVPRWLAHRRAHTWGVTCICWLWTMVGGCRLWLVGCGACVVSVNSVCRVLGHMYVCGFRWGDIVSWWWGL
jgi:hypothetical protein